MAKETITFVPIYIACDYYVACMHSDTMQSTVDHGANRNLIMVSNDVILKAAIPPTLLRFTDGAGYDNERANPRAIDAHAPRFAN